MKEFSSKEIKAQKGISEERRREAIDFLVNFIETFNDSILTKIYVAIFTSKFLSKNQTELIEKRKNAISVSEIHNPSKYLLKYWDILTTLNFATKLERKELALDDLDKILSLRDFYFKFGYLTQKQISLMLFIVPKNINFRIEKAINSIMNFNSSGEYKRILEAILAKFQLEIIPKIKIKTLKNNNSIVQLLCFLLDSKKTEKRRKKREEEAQKIPQTFLSLAKMRIELQIT